MGSEQAYKVRSQILLGVLFIVAGVLFLLHTLGIFYANSVWHLAPLVLVLFGLNRVIGFESSGQLIGGFWLITVGLWLYICLEKMWGINFQNSWPIFIIATGVGQLIKVLVDRKNGTDHGK